MDLRIQNKSISKAFWFLGLLFSGLIITSCDKNRVYDQYCTIPDMAWHMDSTYRFDVIIMDSINPHNILLNIRHGGNYPYRNLILFVNIHFPNEKQLVDTVNCILADQTGKWYGKGWGSLYSNTIMYKRRIRFPVNGNYTIAVQHAMRDPVLSAINNIGIRIEKSE